MRKHRRCGVFGWGVVAPKSPTIDAFAHNLESSESWLTPFDGFGPDNFLVGQPEFSLDDYRDWIEDRFLPRRFAQIRSNLGTPTQYAIGAFIQALGQNPGIEQVLRDLGTQAHVYIGTAIGDIETIARRAADLAKVQRVWDRFWGDTVRNSQLRAYLNDPGRGPRDSSMPPTDPSTVDEEEERYQARGVWWHYWTERSSEMREYLQALRRIEALDVQGAVDVGKKHAIKRRRAMANQLQEAWGAPEPPWNDVSAEIVWNIHNSTASQISMLGRITGLAFAPVAACSTFAVTLKLAMDAIRSGDAQAVVIGATDPPPHPLVVASLYKARVISGDRTVSKPLTGMRGTHVAGGAAIWIVGDYDEMTGRGFTPLGWEPFGIGASSDADHIITPSSEGPSAAIQRALADAEATPDDIGTWDLHATATPGDQSEVATLRSLLPDRVLITARKGTFGHGMGVCGGWELTAQYLGLAKGELLPTPLSQEELNPEIEKVHQRFVTDSAQTTPQGYAGKLSMGIGGVNACVISRPWG